ncbi:CLUMA_CG014813, isoform A [Clunio marinus]|uniref:CLUMA_CG014813, isoform A n=1 Tax=Clunio marinus TaxID=568069 RepID=A0A1J1IR61_9DIPT|nr:CLUMA_CG014813, isoform A [Clunio marinus]
MVVTSFRDLPLRSKKDESNEGKDKNNNDELIAQVNEEFYVQILILQYDFNKKHKIILEMVKTETQH